MPMFGDGGTLDGDTDGDGDSDTDGDVDTDCAANCSDQPTPPFDFTTISVVSGEDIAFDDEGNLIGMSGGDLFKSTKDGVSTVWIPGAGCASGLRAQQPSGDIVCNGPDTVLHFDKEDGTKTVVATGLSYPNGIEVDLDGFSYHSEQTSGEVTKVDPDTGESWVIASGLSSPNGMSFSPDYRTLYVGSFCGGIIYKIEFDGSGEPGPATEFITASSPEGSAVGMTGCFDGMGVDCCGNVYVNDYGIINTYRISPDGETIEIAADLSPPSSWIPNMQWGSGLGGWDRNNLYVADIYGAVYEIPVGIPSKYLSYP